MPSSPTLDSAWDDVLQYLKNTKPSSASDSSSRPEVPSFTLKASSNGIWPQQSLALPKIGNESSPLSIARRRRYQQNLLDSSSSQPCSSQLQSSLQPLHQQHPQQQPKAEHNDQYQWAGTLLSSLSDMDSPDFSTGTKVWRLPNSVLSDLCQKHLCLDNCSAAALAAFIKTIVCDPAISLENQLLLLRCASSSSWFVNKEAVPAIVQSQIAALLKLHSQTIVSGLLLPQLEDSQKMFAPLSAMMTKLIKADDMPVAAVETICDGIASLCLEKSVAFNEHTFQVMEALLGAAPAGRSHASTGWVKRWSEVLQKTAPVHPGSKKLSAMLLHFINKFGSSLDKADLDGIAVAAGYLTTPLKKAIISTVTRKIK
ncbi:hypothetical protein LPJ64_001736 [Coemansia asiatica]|uniref:Fanconi Anaemia group E protein C-terminal domain-containing protein n=1 Tax=Coemansia asiatica TaxID=1052880 RepID=A0A9W8CLQ4_9FUNG|nr:hypothetical protein LPJ64_001736 [Coemansia asiatica]